MRSIGSSLAPTFAASLLAVMGCRDESPTAPEAVSTVSPTSASAPLALASNSWTKRAGVPGAHSEFAVGTAPNAAGQSLVYVFGGESQDGFTGEVTYIYNVATNAWRTSGVFVDASHMNGVGKIGNRLYFTGGYSFRGADIHIWNKTWAYEPSTNRLFQKAAMPKATWDGTTGVIDGKLYVLTGMCSGEATDPGHCESFRPIRQLYRYDPAMNTWSTRRPAPHFHTSGAAGVINGKFYVVGGSGQGAYLDVYDPATNTWQTRAPIPTPGQRLFGAVLQNKLFVLSWSHPQGRPVVLKAYAYDPSTNTWKARAAPPIAGPMVRVILDGQARLFLPGGFGPSYLYTP
jgi:N-acetylneuraminic acid mutarotase